MWNSRWCSQHRSAWPLIALQQQLDINSTSLVMSLRMIRLLMGFLHTGTPPCLSAPCCPPDAFQPSMQHSEWLHAAAAAVQFTPSSLFRLDSSAVHSSQAEGFVHLCFGSCSRQRHLLATMQTKQCKRLKTIWPLSSCVRLKATILAPSVCNRQPGPDASLSSCAGRAGRHQPGTISA